MLTDLIKGKSAIAIPAIPATEQPKDGESIATVATIAVANPLTAEAENAIRAWLEHINETDPLMIHDVLDRCQKDQSVRAYFLSRSSEVPKGWG